MLAVKVYGELRALISRDVWLVLIADDGPLFKTESGLRRSPAGLRNDSCFSAAIFGAWHLAPGALGNRPVIALRHGKRSGGLSTEFEAGWPASQDRLAHLPQEGIVVVATEADHQIAQEEPELAARTALRVLEQVGP